MFQFKGRKRIYYGFCAKRKVENIEKTLTVDVQSLKQNINVLNEGVQTNSNQDKIFIKSLEKIENTLTVDLNSIQQNIKVLNKEVETNSNQDKIFIKSFDTFKVEVKSFQNESLKNAEERRLSLEKILEQSEYSLLGPQVVLCCLIQIKL